MPTKEHLLPLLLTDFTVRSSCTRPLPINSSLHQLAFRTGYGQSVQLEAMMTEACLTMLMLGTTAANSLALGSKLQQAEI